MGVKDLDPKDRRVDRWIRSENECQERVYRRTRGYDKNETIT